MANISGSSIRKRSIDVYGITGEFSVLSEDQSSAVKVKYFQTVASNRENNSSGNSLDLLAELKPMRERVKPEDLNDLRSLLQRDLSDLRVANDLVPYLQGHGAKVGFFPSILVALIPRDFLTQGTNAEYPSPSRNADEESSISVDYSKFWNIENYKMGGEVVSLGRLSVDPNKTDFIVLDGQHRANAFRYMAGTFDAAVDDASIYSIFYQHCKTHDPKEFDAELPVTIVWFEGDEGITPSLISRKLFVDVNTTAKRVSESRNILLNDNELASICTTALYSSLADNGYCQSDLSLLHGGFDCEGEFPADFPSMTIFSPKTMHQALSFFLLSSLDRSQIGTNVQRMRTGTFKHYERVKQVCPDLTDELITGVEDGNNDSLDRVHAIFSETVIPYIRKILNDFCFLRVHFNACDELEQTKINPGSVETSGAWKNVFKGGEGLYNAFGEDVLSQIAIEGKLRTYRTAVRKIDQDFKDLRNETVPNYNSAFETLTSQAGLTGIFMALDKCSELDGWSEALISKFVENLNSFSNEQWVSILTRYKRVVVPENSPKLWPIMREIYLRFIEQKSDDWSFFSTTSLEDAHPDFIFVRNQTKQSLAAHTRSHPETSPSSEDRASWIERAYSDLSEILSEISVDPYDERVLKQKVNDWLDSEISKTFSNISYEDPEDDD